MKKKANIFEYIKNVQKKESKDNLSERQAIDWYRKFITKNFSTISDNVIKEATQKTYKIDLGKMIMFDYEPINISELRLYDKFPLVIPVNLYKSKDNKFCMQAINLHYLKPVDRQTLFIAIKDKLKWLSPNVNGIMRIGNNKLLQQSIHTYRLDRIKSNMLLVPEEYYSMCIFLPTDDFKKGKPF